MFCRDSRTFVWRQVEPKVASGGGVCVQGWFFCCWRISFYTFLILLDEVALHQTCKQCNIGKYLKVFVTKTHTPFYMLLKTDLVSKSKFVCVDSFITRWRRWLVYGLIGHWKSNRSSISSSGSIRSGPKRPKSIGLARLSLPLTLFLPIRWHKGVIRR